MNNPLFHKSKKSTQDDTQDPKKPSLQRSLERMKVTRMERDEAIRQTRAAEYMRLELLGEQLFEVSAELPEESPFALSLLPGEPPRYWIDATAYVVMSEDKHTYQFFKQVFGARVSLFETAVPLEIANKVTDYIAARTLEREQLMDNDFVLSLIRSAAFSTPAQGLHSGARSSSLHATVKKPQAYRPLDYMWSLSANGFVLLSLVLLGFVAGGLAYYHFEEQVSSFLSGHVTEYNTDQ